MDLLGSSLKKEESHGEAEIKEPSQQPQQDKLKDKPTPDPSSANTTTRPGNAPAPPSVTLAQQLTIFYAGSVSVFDAVPPEKAQAIMLIAAAAAAAAASTSLNNKNNGQKQPLMVNAPAAAAAAPVAASPALTRCLSFQSSSTAAGGGSPPPQLLPNPNSNHCKLQAELPTARRHSLQRFLEKRRDRLVSKAPYIAAKTTSDGLEAEPLEAKPQLI